MRRGMKEVEKARPIIGLGVLHLVARARDVERDGWAGGFLLKVRPTTSRKGADRGWSQVR